MTRPTKQLSFFIIVIMISFTAGAQRVKLAINYNAATPAGSSFRDYVSKTSLRGFQGSVLYSLNDHFRVGLQASYNDFYHKFGRQVYKTNDGADISTVLSNTMQIIPVLAKGEYSFTKNGKIRPYIGLGAGVNFINYDQYLGEFEYYKTFAKASFSGDLGVLVPFCNDSQYGFRVSTSYNLTPFKEEGIENIETWNVQAGVVIPLK